MSLLVRYATLEELPKVLGLAYQRAKEFSFENGLIPEPDYDVLLDTLYRNFQLAPCFLVIKDDEIIGFASMSLASFPWSKSLYLTGSLIFVLKNHRNYNILKSLYSEIKKFADLQGVPWHETIIAQDRIDVMSRLHRRLGFTQTGILLTHTE